MSEFLQATLNGLLQGGLFALVAVGFSLVWGVMNVINLAQGAFVLIGAYIAWQVNASFGLDPFLGMLLAGAGLFIVGYVIQRLLINLIVNAPVYMTLLLTFGLELILVNGLIIVFTADLRSIPTSYASRSLDVGAGVNLPLGRLLAFLVAIAVTLILVAFVSRTRTGRAIMATGMDRGAARLMGIRARHIYAMTFGIAGALAGIAGAMIGMIGSFSPTDADQYTLISFVIAVLGGLGNMYGALLGGVVIGLIEAWGGQYLGGSLVDALAFAVLVIVLIFRPQGLLGREFYGARLEV